MQNFVPPLTWFRAFESSARHLSFTKAAEDLNLTQSAVSQHVKALEEKFGCLLFERKHRGLALTDHGRRLLPSVSTAISTLAAAAATFDIGTDKKVLTVAASLSISRWFIVPHLKSFTDQYPDVAVRLTTKTWPDEFSGLDVDVEIRFDSAQSAGRNAELLKPNALAVLAAPSLIKNKKPKTYSIDDIAKLPLIQVIGTTDTWQEWASGNNIKTPLNFVAVAESHGIAIDLARTGLGAVYTNAIIAAPSIQDKSLSVLEHCDNAPKEGYYLTTGRGENEHLAKLFADWLKALVAEISIRSS